METNGFSYLFYFSSILNCFKSISFITRINVFFSSNIKESRFSEKEESRLLNSHSTGPYYQFYFFSVFKELNFILSAVISIYDIEKGKSKKAKDNTLPLITTNVLFKPLFSSFQKYLSKEHTKLYNTSNT